MATPGIAPVPLRILVVDADRRVRDSLRELIECDGALDVSGTAGDPGAAVAAAARVAPDVMVIDPRLPDVDAGIGLIAHLRNEYPAMRVLVMSWADAMEHAAVARGADGLLDTSVAPDDLLAAIASVGRRSGVRA